MVHPALTRPALPRLALPLLALPLLAHQWACAPLPPDRDGDGYTGAVEGPDQDCDDDDATVSPGAAERCNGVDDNCDGAIDEGVTTAAWLDADGDGYGGETTQGCPDAAGWSGEGGDCDDEDAAIHPGAHETCRDGVDQDCSSDDGCRQTGEVQDAYGVRFSFRDHPTLPSSVYGFRDLDGDGHGDVGFGSWGESSPGSVLVLMTSTASWVPGSQQADTEAWAVLDAGTARFVDAAEWTWPDAERIALGQDAPEHGLVVYDVTDLRSPVTTVRAGSSVANGYGDALATVGDVDGDGIDDLAVNGATATVEGREDAGRVDVLLSGDGLPPDGSTVTDLGWTIGGNVAYLGAGESVAGGDLDGDGLADVLIGATSGASGSGHGTVWGMRSAERGDSVADAWVRIDFIGDASAYFGSSLAAADLTGDGRLDVVVGAPAPYADSPGAVVLLPGPFSPYGTVAVDDDDAVAVGRDVGSAMGSRLAVLDFDADGQADLASGASGGDRAVEELAWVRYGAIPVPFAAGWDLTMSAPADHNYFANDLAAVPDTNGDGTDELLVADPGGDGAALFLGFGQ